jgi:hypothetical protein
VDLAAALAADLAALSRALDRPEVDLETQLHTLIDHLQRAVPSYLGLRMTMIVEGRRLSFGTYKHNDVSSPIASSLNLPLSAVAGMDGSSSLVLYAAAPGAFVDLAADLSYALLVDLPDLVLDENLPESHAHDGIDGLPAQSNVNRAVGVLIGQGHTIESAHAELQRLASLDGGHLDEAAAAVLASARKPEIDPSG